MKSSTQPMCQPPFFSMGVNQCYPFLVYRFRNILPVYKEICTYSFLSFYTSSIQNILLYDCMISYHRGQQTLAHKSNLTHCLCLQIKFYWNMTITFIYIWSMAAFALHKRGSIVATETIWPAEPKTFTIQLVTEKVVTSVLANRCLRICLACSLLLGIEGGFQSFAIRRNQSLTWYTSHFQTQKCICIC